jgi:putative DNA primase/helicase
MQFIAPYRLIGSPKIGLHLHPDHVSDLRASGLTDETMRAAGVYSLRPCDFARFFSPRGIPNEIETALCFPYLGSSFARIKLFPALVKMKYAQLPGTGAKLYAPFSVKTEDIIVTEGEKKTLAAHQAGINTVGVGGVWNWLSSGEPISDLKLIEWNGRDVTIIPDSDVFRRRELMAAIYALGRELQARGAAVCIAEIPANGRVKGGLDDFLLRGGTVSALEVFGLGHRIFKSCAYWHGQWKLKKAIRDAA